VLQASKRLEIIAQGPMDVVERRLAQVGRVAKGTKTSLDDLGDGAEGAGRKSGKAADDVKTFQERLKDYTAAVKSAKSASDAFGRSQERASDARVSLADADKALAKAQEDLAKAQQGGSPEQIAAANRRVAAAERTVARAKFDVEESVIAVRDAERELAELRQDPEATPDEIRKAEIRLAEAKFQVVDAEDRQIEVTTDLTEARRQLRIATEGLREGDEELIPFQTAVEDLTKRQTDAAKRYKEALEEQTEALDEYRAALQALAEIAATLPKYSSKNPIEGLIPLPIEPLSGQRKMDETSTTSVVVNVTAGIGGNAYQVGKEIIEVLDQYTSVAGPLDTLMRVA
jgi:chromosome segregation ATPase